MKNLNEMEMRSINGGNVPTSYYMDGDVIKEVGEQTKVFTIIVVKTIFGLGKEILKALI